MCVCERERRGGKRAFYLDPFYLWLHKFTKGPSLFENRFGEFEVLSWE